MHLTETKSLLDRKVREFNQVSFIEKDPICVPHRFQRLQDIEISGFFAAILAWGNRTAIINSCTRLLQCMDNAPYDFIRNYKDTDLKPLLKFVHRTFNATDLFWLLHFLKDHYRESDSLESAFSRFMSVGDVNMAHALTGFHDYVFMSEFAPQRTRKHIATPAKKSACKRLNMYLRWMVRKDNHGVDFGLWKTIQTRQLVCPLDVHVGNVARRLGLLHRSQNDWKAAIELTDKLKIFDSRDPVKYDFALFGLGVVERF